MSSLDPAEFKAKVRQTWDSTAAARHQAWETFEQAGQPLSDRLVQLAQVRPGQRVLDIATGTGELAITAARLVGPGGHVVGIDLSPRMLAIARERAAASRLTNLTFLEMDAETIDFPASTFDAVLCRWGLFLVLDLVATLRGISRAMAPGAHLAIAVFAEPAKVPFMSLALGVSRELLRVEPPPPDAPGPFRLADPRILERALTASGFTEPRIESLAVTYEFGSAEAYTRWSEETQAGFRALLADQPGERQDEIRRAVSEAACRFAAANGRVYLPNECILVAAQRL